jgi:membrane-bound serine protease (ClpP class)
VTLVARKALETRTLRAASGREALQGRLGVVRNWTGAGGQVLVDGALWRARHSWPDGGEPIDVGDPIVVERVSGLTLAVRKAEEWEESY